MKYVLAILLTFPMLAFAENSTSSMFMPASQDLSVLVLGSMFGVMEGILHGGGTQVLGAMFSVFNAAVLIFGSIMMAYILIMSTINTANEGEMLGKKWSSTWVPIRIVIAIILLIPKASGYSLVQVVVMYVVIAGVGAADTVWNKVLDYMQNGGQIMSPEAYRGNDFYGYKSIGPNVLQSQACMFTLQNQINDRLKKEHPNEPQVNFASTLAISDTQSEKWKPRTISLEFPSNTTGYEQYKGICGKVDWTDPNTGGGSAIVDENGNIIENKTDNTRTYTATKLAMWQVVLDTQGAAKIIADNINNLNGATDSTKVTELISVMPLMNAGRDYNAIYNSLKGGLTPVGLTYRRDRETNQAITYDKARDQGWLGAGGYFMDMIKINQTNGVDKSNYILPSFTQEFCKIDAPATSRVSNIYVFVCKTDAINTYITNRLKDYDKFTHQFDSHTPNTKWMDIIQKMGPVFQLLGVHDVSELVANLAKVGIGFKMLQDPRINVHPIDGLMLLGDAYVDIGTVLIKLSVAATLAASLIGAVPAVNPLGFGVAGAASIVAGMINAIGGGFYVTGLTLLVYLPIVPAIIFTFAVIGWLLGVLESIIAAPIVALGIASPAANSELFGKSEPAIMLLLNLFIRPTLIIFGLVAGIILSAVGVWVLSFMFNPGTMIADFAQDHWAPTINFIVKLIVYCMAVTGVYVSCTTIIFQKSFTLIHVLPDKVMRWLSGGHQSQFGSEFSNAEGEAKGAVGDSAKTSQGVLTGGGQAGNKHIQDKVDKENRAREAKAQREGSNAESASSASNSGD
jgi:conjugal transfer/type IV secretion protein DotA/TraY